MHEICKSPELIRRPVFNKHHINPLTIHKQMVSIEKRGMPGIWLSDVGKKVLETPAQSCEMALLTNPNNFFVPGTLGESIENIKKGVDRDSKNLRIFTEFENTDLIIPNTATLTGIIFQHYYATGELLLGQEHAEALGVDHIFALTINKYKNFESYVAVGNAQPDKGISLFKLGPEGNPLTAAIRVLRQAGK